MMYEFIFHKKMSDIKDLSQQLRDIAEKIEQNFDSEWNFNHKLHPVWEIREYVQKPIVKAYTKINKSAVKNMITNGWDYTLVVCPSKKMPHLKDDDLNEFSSNYFNNVPHFNNWCVKMKERLCNEQDGHVLRFYLKEVKYR